VSGLCYLRNQPSADEQWFGGDGVREPWIRFRCGREVKAIVIKLTGGDLCTRYSSRPKDVYQSKSRTLDIGTIEKKRGDIRKWNKKVTNVT